MAKLYVAISYGQGGQWMDALLGFGSGVDRLAARIRALAATCEVFNWDQASTIAARIRGLPLDTEIGVGGGSLGANEAPRVASLVKGRSIDLLFGIQPSLYGARNLIPANVKRAIYFYQPNGVGAGIAFGFGSYRWQLDAGNTKTVLTGTPTYVSHPGTNADSVQNPILAEIKKLASS